MACRFSVRACVIVAAMLSWAAGCLRSGDAPPPAPATEPSVRPGINAEYRNPDVKQWVERFETESREIYRERERIADYVGLKPGSAVADIGAGTGLFTELFARRVGPSGRVFAVDIVPEFLEHIRARSKAAG